MAMCSFKHCLCDTRSSNQTGEPGIVQREYFNINNERTLVSGSGGRGAGVKCPMVLPVRNVMP